MESTGIGKTHPLLLGAAASVIVVSLVGVAAIGGLLPNARSDRADVPVQRSAPGTDSERADVARLAARDTQASDNRAHVSPAPVSRAPVSRAPVSHAPVSRAPVSPATVSSAHVSACASCGTVESIRTVELKGDATGFGAVAGGVTGAVVGNQIGRGNGNTAMTILAAAGGALAGNEIEKNVKKRYSYRVTVRMDDGSFRTVSQSTAPSVVVGEHVRVVDGTVIARS